MTDQQKVEFLLDDFALRANQEVDKWHARYRLALYLAEHVMNRRWDHEDGSSEAR